MGDPTPVRQGAKLGIILPRSMRRVAADSAQANSTPEVVIVVGRDSHSGGSTIYATLPNGVHSPSFKVLAAHRWRDAPQSHQECVQIAVRALQAYAREAGIPLD